MYSDRVDVGKFLKGCARTGIPGWDQEKAEDWLKESIQQVDTLCAKEHKPVVGPMFVFDGVYAVLRKSGSTENPEGACDLSVSGGGHCGELVAPHVPPHGMSPASAGTSSSNDTVGAHIHRTFSRSCPHERGGR
ncbi:hypothetical protein ACFYQA_05210 [Streptomyces sp. NPDC005774]|uniref:hypothetical protein n=1 Tax=Streptomyces sp. NPDC005774 TaxID=3364728 RepID=UPI0036C167E8